jgi:hypothetical protein
MIYLGDFPIERHNKGDVLIPVNSIHKEIFYIKKGVARIYYYNLKGQEITHWISDDNSYITVLSSILSNETSPFGIDVIENDSKIIRVPFAAIYNVKEKKQNNTIDLEGLLMQTIIEMGERVVNIQTKTTLERYNDFLKVKPHLFQRINLGYIASYLGMTQQNLSKIRALK